MLQIANLENQTTDRWIECDAEKFKNNFNQQSFEVSHSLANHPQLQLPSLMELAERTRRTRPRDFHYDVGEVKPGQRWDEIAKSPFSPQEAMQRIEQSGAWFVLKSAQRDPEYRVFLDRGLAEIKELAGEYIHSQIMVEDIIVFITSPRRITTYHIDRECNFLLQIRGTKTIHVFDREDREVLPEEELERFWATDFNAAVYKPHLQHRANSYKMVPGRGVHIPVNCPHWLENDDNVSVSLSVNFQFKDPFRANTYRANFLLRRFGFRPKPPGQSRVLDAVKSYAMVPPVWMRRTYDHLTRNRQES